MSLLASTVMDRSAALLNDVARDRFSYAIQLPYLQIANDTFSDKLVKAGIPLQKKVNTTQVIAAAATTYTLPADFLVPENLWERPSGQTNIDFTLMTQVAWLPKIQTVNYLQYWLWANDAITFLGATQAQDVKLEYIRILTAVTTSGSSLEIAAMSNNFLAHYTASLCARYIGRNKVRADELKGEAYEHLDDLLNIQGKQNQAMPLKRRGFRIFGFRRTR